MRSLLLIARQQERAPQKKAGAPFMLIDDHSSILCVVRSLKTVAPYILSDFIAVFGGRASLVMVTPQWPEVDARWVP